MVSYYIDKNIKYNGTQLHSHFALKNCGIYGDSIVSFSGPVRVELKDMVDIEDVMNKEHIASNNMLSFIIEIFDIDLLGIVALQRLFMSIIMEEINQIKGYNIINRKGDDLYFEDKKLSVSIATSSPISKIIHAAVNIVSKGAPVKVISLSELNLEAVEFAHIIMDRFVNEFESIKTARVKVDWVK